MECIDWERLLAEFDRFEPDAEARRFACDAFVRSMAEPASKFVKDLLERKTGTAAHPETIRALYFFLLEKRYSERLNLLHFAFNVFDGQSSLPEEVLNQTPFPHEDGQPSYRCLLDPAFEI